MSYVSLRYEARSSAIALRRLTCYVNESWVNRHSEDKELDEKAWASDIFKAYKQKYPALRHVNIFDEGFHSFDSKCDDPSKTAITCMIRSIGPPLARLHTEVGGFERVQHSLFEAAFGDRPLAASVSDDIKPYRFAVGPRAIYFDHNGPCPFHRKRGAGASYSECCKNGYFEGLARAAKRGIHVRGTCAFNPPEKTEADWLAERLDVNNAFDHLRIGNIDNCEVKLRLHRENVETAKTRLDQSPAFVAAGVTKGGESEWQYIGHIPLMMEEFDNEAFALMTFGCVSLDNTGLLCGGGITADQLRALIQELASLCEGLLVKGATIHMDPLRSLMKFEKEGRNNNIALLRQRLGTDVPVVVEKEDPELFCALCGAKERKRARLLMCSCRTAFYCSRKHQSLDWKHHKQQCLHFRRRENQL